MGKDLDRDRLGNSTSCSLHRSEWIRPSLVRRLREPPVLFGLYHVLGEHFLVLNLLELLYGESSSVRCGVNGVRAEQKFNSVRGDADLAKMLVPR